MAKMSASQLKTLITEIVRKEIATVKADIIKEVKSDMFDVLLTNGGGASTPQPSRESTNTPPRRPASLLDELKSINSLDEFSPRSREVAGAINIPEQYKHAPLHESQQKVVKDVVNRDYSELMKKMGI